MEPEFVDDYFHLQSDVFYVSENFPCRVSTDDSDTIKINSEFNSQLSGCRCENNCEFGCTCIMKCLNSNTQEAGKEYKGNVFPYILDNVSSEMILSEDFVKLGIPFYECSSECYCIKTCKNRLVQFGPRKNLIIQHSQTYNSLGLFTSADIPQGGFVCEYAGEIISKSEATKRNKLNFQKGLMNYIICVNEHIAAGKIQTFIDPSELGNIGRYLNHSCEPNCIIIPIRVNNPIPKLCLFASKKIACQSELTFDYGIFADNLNTKKNKIKCLCGSKNCLKWLPFSKYD